MAKLAASGGCGDGVRRSMEFRDLGVRKRGRKRDRRVGKARKEEEESERRGEGRSEEGRVEGVENWSEHLPQ